MSRREIGQRYGPTGVEHSSEEGDYEVANERERATRILNERRGGGHGGGFDQGMAGKAALWNYMTVTMLARFGLTYRMWQRMSESEEGGSSMPAFMSTHPANAKRIKVGPAANCSPCLERTQD